MLLLKKNNFRLLKRILPLQTALLFLFAFLFNLQSYSQTDSTKKSMSFDFGLTRDRNINLWPIYKRTISDYEKDKQLLFPIYRSYQNFKLKEKRSHLVPFFWKDSSKTNENLRIVSLYYPSLIHLSKDNVDKTKTFTFLEFAPRINILEFKKSPDGLVMQNNLLFFLWVQNNQITKKSHIIIFPTYWQFKSPTKETTTLLPLYSYGSYLNEKNHYCAITPLYWHFKSTKRNSNLLLPIWWNRSTISGKDTTASNLLLPVYWSHKDRYSNNKVLFPIVWSLQNVRYKSLTIIPFLSYGNSTNRERQHLILSPFYWHFKRYESESITIFPIIWRNTWKTKYENTSSLVIFPLYWQQQNNNENSLILLPFIWSKNSPDYHSFSFIPLISAGHSPDNTVRHIIITPFLWHYKSPDITSNTFFPIWWHRIRGVGDEAKKTNIIFPFYWAKKDPSYQRSIFIPLIWKFKNPDYHTFTFIPFTAFGKSSDGKNSYLAISPLYWIFKTEYGGSKLLFPLWWQNDKTNKGEVTSSSRVVLLYWKYKDAERKYQGMFPLIWNLKNKSNQSFTFFPLFSFGQTPDSTRKYNIVTPLFWHFKNQERNFSTIVPIWWKRDLMEGENTRHFRLLLPIYFSRSDNFSSQKILFPIIWSLRNLTYQSFTFVPLFSFGHSTSNEVHHFAFLPLFWYFKNPEGHSATLIPLLWNSKYGEGESMVKWNVVFPIYWANRDSKHNNHVLAPLIWSFNNSQYSSFTFAPLFSGGHNNDNTKSHLVLSPLFWHFKNPSGYTNVLFPIWLSNCNKVSKGVEKTNILFPVFWSFSNHKQSTKIIFPLIWTFKKSKSHSFTFVPLYSSGKNINGREYKMVSPLYWKFDSNVHHRRILFPLFTSYSDTSKQKRFDVLFFLIRNNSTPKSSRLSFLWPFIEKTKTIDYRYFRFAPLVWSKKSAAFSYFTIQPFYYHSISKEQKTVRIIWELYVHRNQYNISKSNSILWKVATWERFTNGDHEFRLLYLLYSNSNVDGNIEKSLFPFYFLTKENNGNRSLSVMFYFYNSLKRKIPNTKEYYQEERIFWLIRIRSNYRTLKEKGIEIE